MTARSTENSQLFTVAFHYGGPNYSKSHFDVSQCHSLFILRSLSFCVSLSFLRVAIIFLRVAIIFLHVSIIFLRAALLFLCVAILFMRVAIFFACHSLFCMSYLYIGCLIYRIAGNFLRFSRTDLLKPK